MWVAIEKAKLFEPTVLPKEILLSRDLHTLGAGHHALGCRHRHAEAVAAAQILHLPRFAGHPGVMEGLHRPGCPDLTAPAAQDPGTEDAHIVAHHPRRDIQFPQSHRRRGVYLIEKAYLCKLF